MSSTALWLLAGLALAAPAQVPASLTLDDALRLAHEYQPNVRLARGQIDAAKARSDEALAGWMPQISMALGYRRATGNFVAQPGSLPSSSTTSTAPTLTSYDYFTSALTLQQMLWDFGVVWNGWDAAKATLLSQQEAARTTGVAVDLSVRSAYFAAAAARDQIGVAEATVKNNQQHLRQVEGFVKAGTHPEIDLAQSKSDLASSRLTLVNAKNAYTVAKAKLNQAMGVEGGTGYEVVDHGQTQVDVEGRDIEDVVTAALGARPELATLDAQVRAQQFSIKAARSSFWPTLGASVGGSANGRSPDALVPNLSFSLNLNWQIFQGALPQNQVVEYEAKLRQLEAQLDLSRQQVRLDVEQAMLNVAAGRESVDVAQDALEAAQEQLRLAEGRYQAGAGSIIELGDAQVKVTSAASQKVQAEFSLATARAQLVAALGR